jgi:hypothetical protein
MRPHVTARLCSKSDHCDPHEDQNILLKAARGFFDKLLICRFLGDRKRVRSCRVSGEEVADFKRLKALCALHPSKDMICWPVSSRAGSVKDNDPRFIGQVVPRQPILYKGSDADVAISP